MCGCVTEIHAEIRYNTAKETQYYVLETRTRTHRALAEHERTEFEQNSIAAQEASITPPKSSKHLLNPNRANTHQH